MTSPAGGRTPSAAEAHPARGTRELAFARPWAVRAAWIALGIAVLLVIVASVVIRPLDFTVYRWGGHEVMHGLRLYLAQFTQGHNREWFTYPPFAAVLFVPIAALPYLVGAVIWQLISVLALAVASLVTLKLAGYQPSRAVIAAVVTVGIALEPVYHTLYLGQVNLILLALILVDMWRAAGRRPAGIGVGIAAAIKLTPLIFIALFLVTRRFRDALTAAGTFAACALIGYLVAPQASGLYWHHLFFDTSRVGAPYISNQSPYAAVLRIGGSDFHPGHWYLAIPAVLGIAGLIVAAVLARHDEWLGAATVMGTTALLVSPISWTHHWVWILPALVILVRGGRRARIAAALTFVLFVVAPMWFTPHDGGPQEYGFHWVITLLANCYLIAGLAFLGYMAIRAYRIAGGGSLTSSEDRAGGQRASVTAGPSMNPIRDR